MPASFCNLFFTDSFKLDFLVVGEKPTNKKVDLAKKNKIKVIDQITLEKMLH